LDQLPVPKVRADLPIRIKTIDPLRSAQGSVIVSKGSILYGTAHRVAEAGNTVSISLKFDRFEHAGDAKPLSIYLVGPIILERTALALGPPSIIVLGGSVATAPPSPAAWSLTRDVADISSSPEFGTLAVFKNPNILVPAGAQLELAAVVNPADLDGAITQASLRVVEPIAKNGNPNAQYLLGRIYAEGKGESPNFGLAATWYRKAAEAGLPNAQNALAGLYMEGHVFSQNNIEAYKWFSIAATGGLEIARIRASLLAGLMTPKELEDAKRQAAKWLREHKELRAL
jgi:hypothetical protein